VAGRDSWAVLAAIAVLGALLSLGRTSGAGALNTLWLEDGTVFLHDAVVRGPLASIITPYSGYYHLLPRLSADLVALFPATAAAAVTALLAATAVSLVATFVYVASGSVLASRTTRVLVAAVTVLVPAGYTETPNSINELRWYLMYAMFWAAVATPVGRRQEIAFLLVVGLAAFSDNVVAIFLPLFVLRWWVRRSGYVIAATVLLSLGLILNVVTNIFHISEHERIQPRLDPLWAVAAFVLRPVPQGLLGEKLVGLRPEQTVSGLTPVVLAWLLVVVCLVGAWRGFGRPNWPLAFVAGLYCVGLYVAVIVIAGVTAPRYSAPAAMLAICMVLALVSGRPASEKDGRSVSTPPWLRLFVVAIVIATMIVNYRGADLRGLGPTWSDELSAARTSCAGQSDRWKQTQVSPAQMQWFVELPCTYLTR
jgi:hypothetical protein